MDKKQARLRRAARARAKIRELGTYRLCVQETGKKDKTMRTSIKTEKN
jgi:ribosomal protein L18